MKPQVAILGTGRMGSALARAFIQQGHTTHVWNRTIRRSEPLAALGAQVAATVRAAVEAADVVVAIVHDYAASDRLLHPEEVARALRGKLLVQLASGSPRQAREAAAWARRHDIQYLDGAIMATPNFIGAPECTILYSGAQALFDATRPVLEALGGNSVHVGEDPGHASVLDSALLVSMWGEMFGVLQAAAVCEAEGFALTALMEHVKALRPVVDGANADFMARIGQGRFAGDETTLASVAAHHGALHHLLELCEAHAIDRSVPAAFAGLLERAIAAGHAQDDFAVLHTLMR